MGGGAPLAFLNKKTWHPGRMQNLEEVWKREQQAAAEQRKLEELRKQYEDERKDAEFTQMAEEAGYKKDVRLDWMYAGSLAAKHASDAAAAAGSSAAQQGEQPLMGKAPAADEHLSRAERAAKLPSFLSSDTPASQNEQWARLNNDPLLAIKKQEQDAMKRVKENPIKMQQILKEVEKVRSHKHKKDKKEKMNKKDKKRGRSQSHSPSRSRSRSPRRPLGRPQSQALAAAAMPPPVSHRDRDRGYDSRVHRRDDSDRRHRSPTIRAAAAPGRDNGWDSRDGRSRGSPSRHHAAAAAAKDERGNDRHLHRSDRSDADVGKGLKWGRSRSRSKDRDRSHHKQVQERYDERHRHTGRDLQHEQQHKHSRGDGEHQHGHHHHHDSSSYRHHSIGAGGEDSSKYGLKLAAGHRHIPVDREQQAAEAEARAAATRQRLAEAVAAKEAEAAAAAAAASQRRQRTEYKTGKLSAEEKAARLAAMMGNAQEHEQQRLERLRQAKAAEADDQKGVAGLLARAAAVKAEDAFKSAAAAEVFGGLGGGGMSLDARISSRRHYHER